MLSQSIVFVKDTLEGVTDLKVVAVSALILHHECIRCGENPDILKDHYENNILERVVPLYEYFVEKRVDVYAYVRSNANEYFSASALGTKVTPESKRALKEIMNHFKI